jgi:tRNA(Ile)-lysidine synthase
VSIIDQAAETIHRFDMMKPQDRVLTAVSGGPDSMALIHVLIILAPRLNVELAVAHLNHGIRPEAARREEAFVHAMAQHHGLPYYTDCVELDSRLGSLEERARSERYAFLTRTARTHGYTRIAVGHHADDNAEALLMHLMRGSGNRGLGGIPPVRDRWIVRPLIQVRRRRIVAFLKACDIAYVHDESNDDIRFVRNRIRHRLMPLLEQEFNPNIVDTLNRTAMLCREEETWFRSFLDPMLESMLVSVDEEHLHLKTQPLLAAHPALQRRLIRQALIQWRGHLQCLATVHMEALTGLLSSMASDGFSGESSEKTLNWPGGLVVMITEAHIRFFLRKKAARTEVHDHAYTYSIQSRQHLPARIPIRACNSELVFSLVPPPPPDRLAGRQTHCIWLDAENVHFPLTIRNIRPGDRLSPFGMSGTQKIKKLFINTKVPRRIRRTIPLLISQNDVLWVAGIRRSDKVLVTESTREVLCVQWSPVPPL